MSLESLMSLKLDLVTYIGDHDAVEFLFGKMGSGIDFVAPEFLGSKGVEQVEGPDAGMVRFIDAVVEAERKEDRILFLESISLAVIVDDLPPGDGFCFEDRGETITSKVGKTTVQSKDVAL